MKSLNASNAMQPPHSVFLLIFLLSNLIGIRSSPPLGHPLGKGGLIGSSRHNFAATPPFPHLNTPLESMCGEHEFSLVLMLPFDKGLVATGGRKSRKKNVALKQRAPFPVHGPKLRP